MLLSLLLDYESLFDGTLGDWKRPLISVELKDGAKPYHGRGCTGEFSRTEVKKKFWFHVRNNN